jgi:hypothetical protein
MTIVESPVAFATAATNPLFISVATASTEPGVKAGGRQQQQGMLTL